MLSTKFLTSTTAVFGVMRRCAPPYLKGLAIAGAALVFSLTPTGASIVQQAYNLVEDEGVALARLTTLNFVGSGVTASTAGGKTVITIPGVAGSAYDTIEEDGTPLTQRTTLNFVGAGVTCTDDAGNTRTECDIPGGGAGLHVITFVIDGGGSAINTGDLNLFPTANYDCTINRTDISADVSGSITVDIWKDAGAIPTAADKISASAPVTLSSAQLNQNGSITGWSTSVSAGDVFGATVATATTVTRVTIQIWCE